MVDTGVGDCAGHWTRLPTTQIATPSVVPGAQPSTVAGSCTSYTEGDLAHMSSEPGVASAHGWWETPNFNLCPTNAVVTVWLQAEWTNGLGGYYWITVGEQSLTRRPKNVYGDRTTARSSCVGSEEVGYRSIVDVDLVDWNDPPNQLFTEPLDLPCVPSGP